MSGGDDDFEAERNALVERLIERETVERESTADALRSVPRHAFVPRGNRGSAYADRPLPIGSNQTISAPHMVALMVDLLRLSPGGARESEIRLDNRNSTSSGDVHGSETPVSQPEADASGDDVLEIGTGCGYHAAVTAEVVGPEHVFSVEYHADLAGGARERLAELGYGGVSIRAGDGHEGWPEHAPYDAAYLTCAASDFPHAVVEQVRPEGRILAPLDRGGRGQTLVLARKRADGTLDTEEHGGVRFVPMQEG